MKVVAPGATFEFIVPPKQGLKLHPKSFLESLGERFEFIVPPKQGLKQKENSFLLKKINLFEFIVPPKQGLKLHNYFELIRSESKV